MFQSLGFAAGGITVDYLALITHCRGGVDYYSVYSSRDPSVKVIPAAVNYRLRKRNLNAAFASASLIQPSFLRLDWSHAVPGVNT